MIIAHYLAVKCTLISMYKWFTLQSWFVSNNVTFTKCTHSFVIINRDLQLCSCPSTWCDNLIGYIVGICSEEQLRADWTECIHILTESSSIPAVQEKQEDHLWSFTQEIKLVILSCHYTTLVGVSLPYDSLLSENSEKFSSSFEQYFSCESAGLPNGCNKSLYMHTVHLPARLLVMGYVHLSLFPSAYLIYCMSLTGGRPSNYCCTVS